MSETRIEPSCVGIGQKLISVDRKVYTIHVGDIDHFVTSDFRDFFISDTWLYCKADCDEFHSNGRSVELSVKIIYLDLFRPYVSIFSRTASFSVISDVKI